MKQIREANSDRRWLHPERAPRSNRGLIKSEANALATQATKSQLRQTYLEKRSALTNGEVSDASRRIADRFFDAFDLSAVKTIHSFISIPKFNEVDTSLIYGHVWKAFPSIVTATSRLPKSGNDLQHIAFGAATVLAENRWGIREPVAGKEVDPSDIDIVVVPLLCFDTRGFRVGYGKGYYDRFLARCRPDCVKAGVSLFPPVSSIEDVDRYDVRLDLCIMPEAIVNFD